MSFRDYLCCQKCGCKIFYDGNNDLADYLDTYHESKGLICPECAEQLEHQLLEAQATAMELGDQKQMLNKMIDHNEKELAEARAEIERLRQELRDNSTLAARQIVPAEMALDDATAELVRKDRLIEQMREALERTMILLDSVPTYAQDFAKDEKLKQIGKMVNTDGLYALVRDALAAERERNDR